MTRRSKQDDCVALSIRQPWATLVVHGLKRIEIRRWPTKRTGLVYIHAGIIIDRRAEAWDALPANLHSAAESTGGLIGRATVVGCTAYRGTRDFSADRPLHLNPLDWFRPPVMYGFEFAAPEPIEFVPLQGQLFFFKINAAEAHHQDDDAF